MHDGAVIPSSEGDRRAVVTSGAAPGGSREITTARLRLTPVAEPDLDELLALHSDPRAFVEDSTEPLTHRDQMVWVLTRWRESWAEHGVGHLAIRARSAQPRDGQDGHDGHGRHEGHEGHGLPPGLLGVVGLAPLEVEGRPVLSAYWRVAPGVVGRGVASEAMTAVLASPLLTDREEEVIAVTAAGNRPSRALAARLGFRPAAPGRPVPGGREGDVLLVRPGGPPRAHD